MSDEFLKNLNQVIQTIINPEIPFTQTEEIRDCEYCPYKKICHR